MPRQVSDEVWAELDPSAGRLSRRTARRLWLAAAVAAVAALVYAFAWSSGIIPPELVATDSGWQVNRDVVGDADTQNPSVTRNISIRNEGWTPVRILNIAVGEPDRRPATELERFYPRLLRPGDSAYLPVAWPSYDCLATLGERWTAAVVVERSFGTWTVEVPVPPTASCAER